MHDNPQAYTPMSVRPDAPARVTPGFALGDHHLVEITGRDAVAFAQAQFMNDVNAVPIGQWQWNGWLTAKGRVIALFALLRPAEDAVWLLLCDADPTAIVTALQRFVFRSKVTIVARGDLEISAAFAAPEHARGAALGGDFASGVEMDLGAEGGARSVRIGAHGASDGALLARWTAFDLLHGLPRLPTSQVEQWTPQQLSLDRLGAFSVKKGCYPGQEIVARTHFLGKAKRGLALLAAETPLRVGADVGAGDAAMGTVISAADSADATAPHLGLAVLPKDREIPISRAGIEPAREIAFLDGLAR